MCKIGAKYVQNWSKICAKFAIQISARDLRRFREGIKIEIKTLYRAIRNARARRPRAHSRRRCKTEAG